MAKVITCFSMSVLASVAQRNRRSQFIFTPNTYYLSPAPYLIRQCLALLLILRLYGAALWRGNANKPHPGGPMTSWSRLGFSGVEIERLQQHQSFTTMLAWCLIIQ